MRLNSNKKEFDELKQPTEKRDKYEYEIWCQPQIEIFLKIEFRKRSSIPRSMRCT